MIYLFLAIACSTCIALIFRISESKNLDRIALTSINYIVALFLGLTSFIRINFQSINLSEIPNGLNEITHSLSTGNTISTASTNILWAIITGIITGTIFVFSFIIYQKSVKEYGVSLAGSYAKLGILIPLLLSLLIWKQRPSNYQWIGIVLSIIAILLTNVQKNTLTVRNIHWLLIALFIMGGMAEFMNKVYQNYTFPQFTPYFLITTFLIASILSLMIAFGRKSQFSLRELLWGAAVGVANYFSSFFLIIALDRLPSAVTFAGFGAGTIFLITTVGLTVYKESLTIKERLGLLLILVAIVLLNF